MSELKEKFNKNFDSWAGLEKDGLESTFIYLQVISLIGQTLNERSKSKHHAECCQIFDELFSDSVSALYLATCAINKPALVILRRVLELGVAAVYLWDMPHMTYAWKKHDQDLSFSEMLKHVNSEGYKSYVSDEVGSKIESDLFPASRCQKIYGALSDVVHGKRGSFESPLPDKYTFREKDWYGFISLAESVLKILIDGYSIRFMIKDYILNKIPQSKKVLR
jgi:hypothetical protein